MSEDILALVVALFFFWPLIGQMAFALFNRSRRNAGKQGEITDTREPAEILARMYLWPVVLYKYRKAAHQIDRRL